MPINNSSTKFYDRKKPTLQISILKLIADEGICSRSMLVKRTKSYYADVHDACKTLENKQLIEPVKILLPEDLRSQNRFILTEKGLEILIDMDDFGPFRFWGALLSFCLHHEKITKSDFSVLCNKFYRKQLGKNLDDIYLQSNLYFFDRLYKNYDDKYLANINPEEDEVPNSRRVFECLAIHGKCNIDFIVKETKLSESMLNKILSDFSMENYSFKIAKSYGYITNEDKVDAYIDFIQHTLIKKSSKNNNEYDFSFMGVMFALAMKWVDNYFNLVSAGKYKGWYKDISFKEFLFRLGKNHTNKLELIFGKLEKLDNLEKLDLARMFDPIFLSRDRLEFYSIPIALGGNKEIFDSFNYVTLDLIRKLNNIYERGVAELDADYMNSDRTKTYRKFLETELECILVYLKYVDINNIINTINIEKYNENKKLLKSELKIIENMLSKEITFLVYANLIKVIGYSKQWSKDSSYFLDVNKFFMNQYNAIDLDKLLNFDKDIQKQYSIWFTDAINHNKMIHKDITNFQNQINKK